MEDSALFKVCPDLVIKRCVPKSEFHSILTSCHILACEGHFLERKMQQKYCNLVFIGLYLKMHTLFINHVNVVKM